MAAQAVLIAETIAGMKRVLHGHQYSSDSDDSGTRATNRGQKLKRKAIFVHEGHLSGEKVYKRKTEHAGYHRYVISQNPKRYDEYGDELEDDEEDERADAAAAEENPYNDIKLEELLMPLTTASELPNHPSFSIPYNSKVLPNMVQQTCEMIHKERKTLSDMKHLLVKFRGDASWIPGEYIASENDAAYFEIPRLHNGSSTPKVRQQANGNDPAHTVFLQPDGHSAADRSMNTDKTTGLQDAQGTISQSQSGHERADRFPVPSSPVDSGIIPSKTEPDGTGVQTLNDTQASDAESDSIHNPGVNADGPPSTEASAQITNISLIDNATDSPKVDVVDARAPLNGGTNEDETMATEATASPGARAATEDDQMEDIQVPAHRMTTRAQAQAVSDKTRSSHTRSPTPGVSIPPYIHPLFIIPPVALPDRDFGLPPNEAEETRRILMMWIQKQEEVVRGVERLYDGLLRADRMRRTVYKWCKAEGHVGEMSDGEDWYDKEEWGLDEDLKKGQLEEEDDTVIQGKKTLSALSIAFNPIFWNTVARQEYHNKVLTRLFNGNSRLGCYALAVTIFGIGIFRDMLYERALRHQPTLPLLLTPPFTYAAYALIVAGNILVLSSMYALGIAGTYLGDYFGILMEKRVTSFPFNITGAPMYYGSTLSFLGTAILYGRPAGLLLTGEVLLVYRLALGLEDPFTAQIYAKAERERKDGKKGK